jgi:hypothetical protein
MTVLLCLLALLFGSTCLAGEPSLYPREHLYDTTVHPDDALVNVRVAFNRWPDCTTLESAITDIFRLEGVTDKTDQDKALALWKWWRILVSATGGGYAYEAGNPRRPVTDPHKIFTVYGHHQCDGQSWAYVSLWRAAGYIALDQCHWGHTIASLRYRDRDGRFRFHDFDPQARAYYWDEKNRWVGTWTNPIMRAKVHRHIMQPQHVHSGRTCLRVGELRERRWDNTGQIVPSGRDKKKALESRYYRYAPGKTDGVYAAAGGEVQTLLARTDNLSAGSVNTASAGSWLQPAKAGAPAVFLWRMAKPFVVADASLRATVRSSEDDSCRFLISDDGETWEPVYVKTKPGIERIDVNLGLDAWKAGKPNVYTGYTFYVKAELRAAKDPASVGLRDLEVRAVRMLNKRTLPHLRPGENYVRVTADQIREGHRLELTIDYEVSGKPHREQRTIGSFPHYLKIDVPDVPPHVLKNYDKNWNTGTLRMKSFRMRLLPANAKTRAAASLDAAAALPHFQVPSPHPADMTRRRICKKPETDVRQTNGFFPQAGAGTKEPDDRMKELVTLLNGGKPAAGGGWRLGRQWLAAEELGNYPAATGALLDALPQANIDLTLFICKALARNPHPKMIPPLLAKWKDAPKGSPGTRYIPDVLAAIGDRSVVPQLLRPLQRCRFDFRFHIAHALGILGGPDAETALEHLAEHDPFPAVREEAERALEKLRKK